MAPIPADLRIDVEIDGAASAPIDGPRLQSIAPDYADDERRAWRLETLLGKATSYTVTGARDVVVELHTIEGAPIPALLMSRRGDLVATLVDPKDPFPRFHGEGGRLGRPGDTLPRVSGVKRIAARH